MNSSEDRPSTRMSQEEHGVLSKLTAAVEVLAGGQKRLEDTFCKFVEATDSRFSALSERGRFSRGDLFAVLGAVVTIGSALTAMISMSTDNKLAPIQTENRVSIVDRTRLNERQDQQAAAMTAGKEARLLAEKETAVRLGINDERTRELYFTLHGHYPSNP